MSTKAIRELLSDYLSVCAARNSEYGKREPDSDERGIHQAALAEVEAIERAAKALDDNLCAQVFASNPQDVEAALDLMENIAAQAT